ncbi:MAG TPA: hypothetical protein PL096_07970, partial [Micropepsaceae bacterium]|nr:hypothetical protein [Micropepsaceae bacterium]
VEAATVVYELGGIQSGTKTVYWDNYGRRELAVSKTSITAGSMTIEREEIVLTLPDFIYTIDPVARTATRVPNPVRDMAQGQPDVVGMGLDILRNMGGTQTGTETIAGITCDVWSVPSLHTTTCIWQGVPLSNETNMAGMNVTVRATSIVEGGVDPALFELDPGLTIRDMPAMPNLPGR